MIRPFGDVRKALFGEDLRWLRFAAWVPLIFFLVRLLDTVLFDLIAARRRSVVAPMLLRQLMAIVFYFILFASAISAIFNYSITTWLATTTVLAAILGLALQDTLGNLFSGVALAIEDSFEVGDVIHSGEYFGVVEGVSWRSTRIRGFNNQIVSIPNAILSRERLEIFPRNNLNGRSISVNVDNSIQPSTVIDVLTQAAVHVDGVARDLPCHTRVASYGDSSVTYELKYYVRDYSLRDRIDAEIRKAMWYAMQRNSIALPVQTYRTYVPFERKPEVPADELMTRLREVDILSPLSDEALQTLASAARVHAYGKGETIIRRGAVGDSMFVMHQGTISVRMGESVPEAWHELAQLGPGSIFGEMALLTGEARTADVVAITDVLVFEIVKESLQPILQDHPQLAAAISAKVMSRRDGVVVPREAPEEEQRSVLEMIRDYFGL